MMNALLTVMIVFFGISVFSWAEEITVTSTVTSPAPSSSPAPAGGGTAPATPVVVPAASAEEETPTFAGPVAGDPCKDILPQAEADYQTLSEKYQQVKNGQLDSYDGYTGSFAEMTEVLFQLTDVKEQETKRISESRDLLKSSVEKFNQQRSPENSKLLQDQYMDLTVRLYSSVIDGRKILDTLKSQLAKVETTRSQFENSKIELEKIDQQRLALEAKLINLKIRCHSDR